jgi:hypothetical protein
LIAQPNHDCRQPQTSSGFEAGVQTARHATLPVGVMHVHDTWSPGQLATEFVGEIHRACHDDDWGEPTARYCLEHTAHHWLAAQRGEQLVGGAQKA